ncbi:MAG: hypothetical protein OHK0046_14710 [Anaerolineae bacterium]
MFTSFLAHVGPAGEAYSTLNIVLDFVLVAAAIWMIFMARGIGGLVGRTLNYIVIGAIILGFAHLIATIGANVIDLSPEFNNFTHRIIVLLGFILLAFGFRKIGELKR